MQYVGRAIGSVSKTWSSINPATLSGAIDVIVVEQADGELACSPFHVRFGKFQLLRPSQKKVDFVVNGEVTNLPMKLGDGGEAFFVFETDGYIPPDLQTSPVLSPVSSPSSPGSSMKNTEPSSPMSAEEPEYLDIGEGAHDSFSASSLPSTQSDSALLMNSPSKHSSSAPMPVRKSGTVSSFDRAKKISKKLIKKNIPSKVEANGDIMLDMQGYKSNDRDIVDSDALIKQLLLDEFGDEVDLDTLIDKDIEGNIRIIGSSDDLAEEANSVSLAASIPESALSAHVESPISSASSILSDIDTDTVNTQRDNHFKTLRLTSEQLKCLSLKPGENDLHFSVNKGRAVVSSKLYLWKYNVPIVISDIDGTITKSDALGHVLTMLGRDWTHVGVAKLFADIKFNGYNIMYLTARSVGLADSTRSYLNGIVQDGIKLPGGPVILSPERTIAALRREIVLKKPEVFKMACLNDIKALYDKNNQSPGSSESETPLEMGSAVSTAPPSTSTQSETPSSSDSDKAPTESSEPLVVNNQQLSNALSSLNTPFYAGFGNRITDALSYRTVGIPSSKIFTINPDGEVHLELLEMAGYKSSYVSIGELVDQFFPPVNISKANKGVMGLKDTDNQFSDVNYWRSPVVNLDDLSDDEDSEEAELSQGKREEETPASPSSNPRLAGFFSRSPTSTREGQPTKSAEDDSFYEEEEGYDEELDPDYIYEDEEEMDEDLDDDIDEDLDDDYDEDVDPSLDDEREFDEDEELDGDLLDDENPDTDGLELSDEFKEDSTSSDGDQPSGLNRVGSGLGIASRRSYTSMAGVDMKAATGTFIKANQMLSNLTLDDKNE